MKYKTIQKYAREILKSLVGESLDVLTISKPTTAAEIANLAKIVSKLSPLMGNLIEFKTTEYLNTRRGDWPDGRWFRQDPGFPDVIFKGCVLPAPGFEIKAWFPFATEITGRFKDSQNRFRKDEIDLVILAWLPEFLFWGKPKILDVCIVSGKSVAEARDRHYHKPPHYLVVEPEDTSSRTANLQQSNTNGYVIQNHDASSSESRRAKEIVSSWGPGGEKYSTSQHYQDKIKKLMGAVSYRLDTNYAKIDRIEHAGVEDFKTKVLSRVVYGRSIKEWGGVINDLPVSLANEILNNSQISNEEKKGAR